MAIPRNLPYEPYSQPTAPSSCHPTPQLGAIAFRDFVLENFGGLNLGIARSCAHLSASGKFSDHHEGRAWDWGVDANNPADVNRVNKLFSWLFKGDNDGIRWAGITYLIWDGKIWTVRTKQWRPYGGSPHREHVHVSLGWPGAKGDTALYQWLRGEVSDRWISPPLAFLGGALGAGLSYWYFAK